jgi:hypothetical protein
MNTDLTASTIPARTFRQWLYNNHLHAPFQSTLHTLPDYHTWHDTTNGTTIDHILHTPLPNNVHTAQHATLNDNATTQTWSRSPPHHPSPLPLRIEIDYMPTTSTAKDSTLLMDSTWKLTQPSRPSSGRSTTSLIHHWTRNSAANVSRRSNAWESKSSLSTQTLLKERSSD